MMDELLGTVIITISLISLILSIYAYYRAKKAYFQVISLMRAASLSRKIEETLSKVKQRPRRRYILFRVETSRKLTSRDVARALYEEGRRVLGETGLVASGLHLIAYYEDKGLGVVRVRSTYKYQALALLGMIRNINNERVLIIPLGTSGTYKSAMKRIKRIT